MNKKLIGENKKPLTSMQLFVKPLKKKKEPAVLVMSV